MKLRTLIADDEPLARKRLRQLLSADQEIEIVAECRNGSEVVSALQSKQVDIVFLDIQMPGNTGFEVIEKVGPRNMPTTVFVTAHNVYAVEAFDVHALDYLIKPISEERLAIALERVKGQFAAKSALTVHAQFESFLQSVRPGGSEVRTYPRRLLVPNGAEGFFLAVSDIEWIEAADDYACIHSGGKTYTLRDTIKQLITTLDPAQFVRIHRSAIVNVDFASKVLRDGRTESWLVLSSGQRLKMSKSGWQALLSITEPTSGIAKA
jgi:two-component system, LytTR family, response regulator